jgi:hypothetical protein
MSTNASALITRLTSRDGTKIAFRTGTRLRDNWRDLSRPSLLLPPWRVSYPIVQNGEAKKA